MGSKKILKFVGIDSWNRPIFKYKKEYYGSTDILFPYEETGNGVKKKVKIDDLCYFGNSFNCEPIGIPININEYKI